MRPDPETTPDGATFDFAAYPPDTCFHERRGQRGQGKTRTNRTTARPPRRKTERRRRIDPTTYEKQYTEDELEFMNAMHRFKVQQVRAFPSYREVLKVALELGYRKLPVGEASATKPADESAGSQAGCREPRSPETRGANDETLAGTPPACSGEGHSSNRQDQKTNRIIPKQAGVESGSARHGSPGR